MNVVANRCKEICSFSKNNRAFKYFSLQKKKNWNRSFVSKERYFRDAASSACRIIIDSSGFRHVEIFEASRRFGIRLEETQTERFPTFSSNNLPFERIRRNWWVVLKQDRNSMFGFDCQSRFLIKIEFDEILI